jgi:hypothetical protein
MGFVIDRVTLGQAFLREFHRFPPAIIIPSVTLTHFQLNTTVSEEHVGETWENQSNALSGGWGWGAGALERNVPSRCP